MTTFSEHLPNVHESTSISIIKAKVREIVATGRFWLNSILHRKTTDISEAEQAILSHATRVKGQKAVAHGVKSLYQRTAPIGDNTNLGIHLASLNDLLSNHNAIQSFPTAQDIQTPTDNADSEALARISHEVTMLKSQLSSRTEELKSDKLIGRTITIYEGGIEKNVQISGIDYNQPIADKKLAEQAHPLMIRLKDDMGEVSVTPTRLQIMMQKPVNYGPKITTNGHTVDVYGNANLSSQENQTAIKLYITDCITKCRAQGHKIQVQRNGNAKIEVKNRTGQKFTIYCSLKRDIASGYVVKIDKVSSGWETWFSRKFDYYKGQRLSEVQIGMILNSSN